MLRRKTRSNLIQWLLLCLCIILAACSVSQGEIGTLAEDATTVPTGEVLPLTLEPTVVDAPELTDTPTATATPLPTSTPFPPAPTNVAPEYLPPAENPIAGIEIHSKKGDIELPLAEQSGASWVRVNALMWSDVEPFEGRRDWETIQYLERLMVLASEQGLENILIVRSTPMWARTNQGAQCGSISEEKFQAFTSFMVDLVDRYSVPPYNVKYWEIWNEPDVDPALVNFDSVYGCWGDHTNMFHGGQYYGRLLQVVYPQVKAANPDVKIVIGGLLLDCDPINPPEWPLDSGQLKDCSSSRFLEGILESGAGDSFDVVSFHSYDYYYESLGAYGNSNWNSIWNIDGPVLVKKVEYLLGLLTKYGLKKELLNTENALICGSFSSQATCSSEDFELTKAYYAAISLGAARKLGLSANIWYSMLGWRSSGLYSVIYKPLPAQESFRFSVQELDQATFRRVIDDYPGLTGYEFDRAGTTIWLIWSLEDTDQTIHVAEAPDAVHDIFGNPQASGMDLSVTVAPIYLEWGP